MLTPAPGFWPQCQFYPLIFLAVTFLLLPSQLACSRNFRTNGLVNFSTVSQTGEYGGPAFLTCLLHCNSWPPPTVNSLCQTRGFADFGYVTKAYIEISVEFLMNCHPVQRAFFNCACQHRQPLSSSAFTWCADNFYFNSRAVPPPRLLPDLSAGVCLLSVCYFRGGQDHPRWVQRSC